MERIWLLWDFRSLEISFATTPDLKVLSDSDGDSKLQPQGSGTFMQISSYYTVLAWLSIPYKIVFPWSHLHLELSPNFLL